MVWLSCHTCNFDCMGRELCFVYQMRNDRDWSVLEMFLFFFSRKRLYMFFFTLSLSEMCLYVVVVCVLCVRLVCGVDSGRER